jgi:hypothetical protein
MHATPNDDPLERAVAALRRVPVDGPSGATLVRILAVARASDGPGRPSNAKRRQLMITLTKIAATLILAATGIYVVGHAPPAGAAVDYAEVAGRFHDAKALAFRLTIRMPDQDRPAVSRQIDNGQGVVRSESLDPPGPVSIVDIKAGRGLSLNPAEKTALALTWKQPSPQSVADFDFVGQLRTLVEKRGEPIGTKAIDGVEAQGFRVRQAGPVTTVWADPRTRRPVRIEMTLPVGAKPAEAVLSDFDFDPKLDPAQFRLDPPEGYTVQKVETTLGTPEESITTLLRTYAEASDGAFPPRFDDWAAYGKVVRAKNGGAAPPNEQVIRFAQAAAIASAYTATLEDGYGYRPEGVKLGDADKVLFWYRPNGSATYRAIFGDLHAADLPPDRVPKH